MAKTPPSPAPDAPEVPAGPGKNRPTPSRADQQAARKRPLVDNTKEARARAKAELAAKRERIRLGMAAGDEKYLPTRDRGPQKRFARDFVDGGLRLGEGVMPAMIIVILISLVPVPAITYWAFIALWMYVFFVVGDMIITSIRLKRAAAEKFGGKERLEKGLGWYAAMRTIQMRFMRIPKPQVKIGNRPIGRTARG